MTNNHKENQFEQSLHCAFLQSLFWAIMFGAGESSFGLFASQIHAPSYFYGLLIGIPSFLGPFAQVIAANILERYSDRKKIIVMNCIIQAISFLPLSVICLAFYLEWVTIGSSYYTWMIFIFLASITLYYFSGHMVAPPWSSLMSDIVPEDKRGKVFAKLGRAPNLIALIAQLLVGGGLYATGNGQVAILVFFICFILSFFSRMKSAMIISKMVVPAYVKKEGSSFTFLQFIKRGRESNFLMFVLFVALLHMGVNISGPYYLPYWVETLSFSRWEWVVLSASGTIISVITLLAWGRFADLFGNKHVLKYSSFIIAILPFLWMFTEDIYLLISFQMLGAVFWTGFNLSAFNYILEAASAAKRARCVAYFNIIVGIGVILGAGIGNEIYSKISLEILGFKLKNSFLWVLFFSGVFRLMACVIFLRMFKELRAVDPFSFKRFFVQVMGFRGIYGIKFDISNKDSKQHDESKS